jgi:hypothetical protein
MGFMAEVDEKGLFSLHYYVSTAWRSSVLTNSYWFNAADIQQPRTTVIIIIIIIISGSTVLVTKLAASRRRFRDLIKTLVRFPLNEISARLKGLYLHRTTQHRNTQTNMSRAGFETLIPVIKRPPTPSSDDIITLYVNVNVVF